MLFYTCKTRVSHYLNLAGVKCSSKKEKNEDTRDSKHMFCAFKTQEFATSHHSHHWNLIAQKVKVFTIKVGSLIDIQFPDGVLDKSTTTNKVSLSLVFVFVSRVSFFDAFRDFCQGRKRYRNPYKGNLSKKGFLPSAHTFRISKPIFPSGEVQKNEVVSILFTVWYSTEFHILYCLKILH